MLFLLLQGRLVEYGFGLGLRFICYAFHRTLVADGKSEKPFDPYHFQLGR